ncbi:MAG: hypothetical protein H7320_11565 [Ferruginibacter sp.]|nr:hypothetical protein [Ferruginibacter sp.]
MNDKILYILGAGASAQALPLARSVWGSDTNLPMKNGLAYELNHVNFDEYLNGFSPLEFKTFLNNQIDQFKELSAKADEFGDVDTYAKYLHLTEPGSEKFKNLKEVLAIYFLLKQKLLNARDERYLPWLINIMDNKMFPKNIKILSWNYDFQVELAALHFGESEEIEHKGSSFSYSAPKFSYYPNLDPTFSDFNTLSLIHLNGIAGVGDINDANAESIFQKKYTEENLLKNFIGDRKMRNRIHFAWENSGYHDKLMDIVSEMIDGVSILIVIGYSFPFFNRAYDKLIFNKLKSSGGLRKIYFQDPVLDGQQLIAQFNLESYTDIIHIQNTKNFHVPFEL